MALISCPDCGKEVSDRATACIHCGCPLDEPIDIRPFKFRVDTSAKVGSIYTVYGTILEGDASVGDKVYSWNSNGRIESIERKDTGSAVLKLKWLSKEKIVKGHTLSSESDSAKAKSPTKINCPYCQSTNIELIGSKMKMRTSLNLNPLRPFTLTNTKQVKNKRAGTDWVCAQCGKTFMINR